VWENAVDLKGKNIVLVGTGCSGVQVATALSDTVASMTIIQRQPEHILPNPLVHADVDALERWAMENIPFVANWIRLQALSSSLQDMRGMVTIDPEHRARTGGVSPLNDGIRDMCLNYLKSHFPDDPEMVAKLTPGFPVFAKRPILDCGFFDTLKKPNVTLISGTLAACEKDAVILTDGTRIPCDVLLLSTGYEKHEGTQFDITGRNGKRLREAFTPAPFSYNGMLVPGFPNFALMAGPYSRLVANHAVVSEQQVHYLIELLQTMMDEDFAAVDVDEAACRAWVAEMDAGLANTTWVNCGNAHGYYRHASGKVIMAIPWHNTRIWHELRQPRLEDFVTTPREPGAKPEPLPADMLSI
jgi:cation diffusion facilitator CzcD-associated flavoprotein CzcO